MVSDRAKALQIEAVSDIDRLREAIRLDIAEAKIGCGGDGKGCPAFKPYYGGNLERCYAKCGQCPMEALSHVRAAVEVEG